MGKSTRTQRLREETLASVMQAKQKTLDSMQNNPQKEIAEPKRIEQKKQIIIIEIVSVTREDELDLKVGFSLLPSRAFFLRITSDLYFNGQKLNSAIMSIPQGPLTTDSLEFPYVLGMKGIAEGSYVVRVEMYELWSSGEKLSSASKEVSIQYVPQTRESRLVKIPTVKSVAGNDLTVLSASEKEIYREIEEDTKRELASKQDEW
jgi:hypothetical protein